MSQSEKKEYKAISSPRAVSAISSHPCDRETPFTTMLLSCAANGGESLLRAAKEVRSRREQSCSQEDLGKACISMKCFSVAFSPKPRCRLQGWEAAHPRLVFVKPVQRKRTAALCNLPRRRAGCGGPLLSGTPC